MAIKVVYDMTAQTGKGDEFAGVLAELAATIRALPGCAGVEVLRKQDAADQFLSAESWPSDEAYAEAGKLVPQTAFAPLKPLLGGPPARAVYQVQD